MPIRAITDFYSEVLPVAGNSVIAPTGQRISIKKINNWRSELQGVGLHILDDYPSELDSLSLAQAFPIVQTETATFAYEHVVELRIDWVGVKYVTFVYKVASPKPSNPGNIDFHYYPMLIRGTSGGSSITNPTIVQDSLIKTILCKEDGPVTVCADVPVNEEVIFVLKNLTTGTLEEINFFNDDIMERKGSDFTTSEISTNRCLTIPVSKLNQSYNYEVQIIANGTTAIDECSGCLEAILETQIIDIGEDNISREIQLLIPSAGTGVIADTFGNHDANAPYTIISNVSRMYFIISFQSDIGCTYRRSLYVTFALAKPTANFELYQLGYEHKAKNLYIRGLAPNESYIFNYSMGDDTAAIPFTSDQYGVYRQDGDFSDLGGQGPFQITSNLVFNGLTCPSLSISPNNFDPIEPTEINIQYDAGECLGAYSQTFNLCVDPGTIEGGADPVDVLPTNSTCETAFTSYFWPFGTGTINSFGTTDGGTMSTPDVDYTTNPAHDRDVWHRIINPSTSPISVVVRIDGSNDAVFGDEENNPLNIYAAHLHNAGLDCNVQMTRASQGVTGGLTLTMPSITIPASSFAMLRITTDEAGSGEYYITIS